MEQRLTLITLGVSDLKAAIDFYQDKFGWTKSKSSNDNIAFFQLNGLLLSLYPKEKLAEDAQTNAAGSGFKSFTLAYNARSEKEVNEVMQSLKAKGVTIVKEANKAFWGGYSGYITDLDGNLWEIAYNPFLPLDEKGNVISEE
jgi:uncharacterized glyoxalase superfamily protein PhnB